MLALLGAATIAVLLAVIMFNRCSPLVALIVIPAAAALIGGFGGQTALFMVDGITRIAPVAAMFVFAILFFGVVTDAGMLDPIIGRVLRLVGVKPTRIAAGSALLALLVHLDGSGAVCFLVVIPAMLPLYERLGMDKRVLACVVSMAAGVNFLPWTGPTVRAAAALKIPVTDIFRPMLAVQAVGLAFVFTAAWLLGKREERRLGAELSAASMPVPELTAAQAELRRPRLFGFNLALTIAVMAVLVAGIVAPAVAFMGGAAIALIVNYPRAALQRERVDAHARAALMMAAILLAAGAFTGVMTGTGALKALATSLVAHLPAGVGSHIPFALSLVAMPLSMLFDPDSFYFGVMPVIAELHGTLGGHPVQIAQAALVGQMTAGFPVSPLTPATFLVSGLAGIELSAHQKFAFPLLYAASLIMALACVVFGLFPI
jgi:CitMHS family citrate-Mg2+:H+ or citrate-Ca2+:H+ symporter